MTKSSRHSVLIQWPGLRRGAVLRLVLLCLLMNGQLQADQIKPIDIFSLEESEKTDRSWKAAHASVSGQNVSRAQTLGGLRFPCLFRDNNLSRVFWDRQVNLDLGDSHVLELDVSCARPDAVRTVGLYLKSGDGWYLWIAPLGNTRRNKLAFPIKTASIEGRPEGWHKITAVRLSFTKASDVNTDVIAYSLCARSCDIVVVEGTLSTDVPAEKRAARRAARRLSGWLEDLGVSHAVIGDEDVIAGRLRPARVAVLPYNPGPPDAQMAGLSAFAGRGGKLLVFYSSDPELARLMHMKLGEYQAASKPGQWSSFCFNKNAPDHLPAAVYQESQNIRPVYPDAPDARVIAYWKNAEDVTLSDPAWVQSDRGFWMSHVLLEGDDENKKSLVLGLLGFCEPSVWKTAAHRAMASAGNVGAYDSFQTAVSGIAARAKGGSQSAIVNELLSGAGRQFDRMCAASTQQKYAEVLDMARALRAVLIEAYARVQRPVNAEFRGVWNHSGTGLYPGDWNRTCKLLSACGMNAVFPNMLWPGAAHYPSDTIAPSYTAGVYGDQLKLCASAAREYGLQVHVWKVCWNLGNAPEPWVQGLEQKNRLQRTDKGETVKWLCPSHPDNAALELNAILEVVGRYQVNGIHLDYVRYPDVRACYCSGCKKRFEQQLGRNVRDWPESVTTGELREQYSSWRCDQMTGFVRSVRETVRRINPDVKISAAVYQTYPGCITSLGQDWGRWLKEGLVDFVCPMDYVSDIASFRDMVERQLKLHGSKGRVFPGIGVTAAESRLSPDQVIDQIETARQAGTGGFILFDLDRTLEKDVLPVLSLGVTRSDTPAPETQK